MSHDESQLASAVAGDRSALSELLKRHSEELRAGVQARLPERWQSLLSADDVLQQTFLDAFLAVKGFVPSGDRAFRRWLRRLAENNLTEAIRALETEKRGGRVRRIESLPDADAWTTLLDRLITARAPTTPSLSLSRREAAEGLRAAVARLPDDYRTVIERHDLEGRTIGEVAAELGRTPGAVHLLRHRAVARLRDAVGEITTRISKFA